MFSSGSDSESICFGDELCCDFVGVDKAEGFGWNSPFELAYTNYGSSENNIVEAQVVYVDYSLNPEDPYSDIVYSSKSSFPAVFYDSGNYNKNKEKSDERDMAGEAFKFLQDRNDKSIWVSLILISIFILGSVAGVVIHFKKAHKSKDSKNHKKSSVNKKSCDKRKTKPKTVSGNLKRKK